MVLSGFFNAQAPVVQTLDSAIHWITKLVLLVFIRWIVIYPVDSAIHRLNNWGQGPVSRKSRKNFGPEKPFVKL